MVISILPRFLFEKLSVHNANELYITKMLNCPVHNIYIGDIRRRELRCYVENYVIYTYVEGLRWPPLKKRAEHWKAVLYTS